MSMDTTFRPMGNTVLVGTAAVAAVNKESAMGVSSFRVRCLVAAYLTWGPTAAVTAAGAPTAGNAGVANTLGMPAGGNAMYIEVPPGSFFISSVAASFEVTPGAGGTGG